MKFHHDLVRNKLGGDCKLGIIVEFSRTEGQCKVEMANDHDQ